MSTSGTKKLAGMLCAVAAMIALPASAQLFGDTVQVEFGYGPVVDVVVGPGVELPGAGPLLGAVGPAPRWNIDIGDASLRIDFVDLATYGGWFTFSGLAPKLAGCAFRSGIAGITVTTNFPASQFDVVKLASFTQHSVRIQIAPDGGNLDWSPGQFVEVALQFTACPDLSSQMFNPNASFFDIQAAAKAQLALNPPRDEDQEDAALWWSYHLFEWFWEGRVNTGNSNRSGSFHYAARALQDYTLNAAAICPASAVPVSWRPLGPQTVPTPIPDNGSSPAGMGIVISVAVDPRDPNLQTIYAGTNASGLWRTTDGGAHWASVTEAARLPEMGVQDVVIDSADKASKTLYIATGLTTFGEGYGLGVLKSTDGGASWTATGLSFTPSQNLVVQRLIIDPSSSSILYALVGQSVYKTLDAGNTWTSVALTTNTNARLRDIEMMPGNPTTLYVAGDDRNGSHAGAWRSTDGGLTWTVVTPPLGADRIELAVTPAEPASLYALYGGNGVTYLQKSTDKGTTWQQVLQDGSSIGAGYWKDGLAVAPNDPSLIYACALQTFRSIDGGATFTQVTDEPFSPTTHAHNDCRALVVPTGTANAVFTGNDGGIGESLDGGRTWHDLSAGLGLAITQFYRLGGIESNPDFTVQGAQDLGTNLYRGGAWTNAGDLHCDGGEVVIDPTDEKVIYTECNGDVYRSGDAGVSWEYRSSGAPFSTLATPLVIDPTDHNTLLGGWYDVWKTTDQGQTWTQKSKLGNDRIRALAIARSDPKTIYFAELGTVWSSNPVGSVGAIWRSTDGGETWTDISAGLNGLQWAGITDIEIDPAHPQRLWVAFNGYWEGNRVFHSDDGGATWVNQSKGLPGFQVNKIAYQRCTDDVLYAATDVGVFRWNPTTSQWECWSDGLPVAIVTDFEINYSAAKIRATTFGRGLWEADLPPPTRPECLCAEPPSGMALWLPFDETAGSPPMNAAVAGGGGAISHGAPTPTTSGMVANALCFDGVKDFVDVADYDAIDFGTGPFSIDLWLRFGADASGLQTLVDKRFDGTSGERGYALSLFNGVPQARLADGSPDLFTSSTIIAQDGQWHHLALTVDRASPTGGRFYRDGVPVGPPFNPTAHPGSLSSPAPLRVGAFSASAKAGPYSALFQGCMDEVEVFQRALTPEEVLAIYHAGGSGQCKHSCHLAWDQALCALSPSVAANPQVCNLSPAAQTFDVSLAGLPVQSGCALAGPTSFTPASGSVTVPAGQCATIPTTIARAANMRQTGSAGCYQMTVQVPGTAETFRCRGSIVDGASLCWHFPDSGTVLTDHTEGIVRLTATNTSSSPFTLDYEAIVLDQLLAPDTRAVSLDDQLPGAPIHGHLDLQPGASESPEVHARFVAPDPTHTYTLLVQADTHGNGKLEPVAAASLRSVIQPSCVTDLYGVDDAGRLVAVSRDTFTERPLGRIGFATVKALAYDAGADTLYGLTANGALLVIDRETGSGRLLARLNLAGAGAVLPGLAFAVDAGVKRLYAVTAPGVLYRIDLVPGYPATRLGSTVFESHQALVVGLAFEPSTGTLYGVDRNSDALVVLDKTTGAVLRTLPNSELLYPQGLAFDPATGTLFGTHDSGVLATYELSSGIASFAATTGITGGFITGGLTFAPRPRGQVLLQALRRDVKLLVASAALTEEQGDQLTRTLLSAIHQLSSGDIDLASARLRRFTRQVRKLMHAGILSHADGRALIARAGSLLANPSC